MRSTALLERGDLVQVTTVETEAMELRHLRHFLAVAEELHFKRAADRIGIEQSPLSRSIRNLEQRLGVALFERTRRSTRLTVAGERLFVHARALLAAADEARVDVRATGDERIGHFHVGIGDGVPLARVARLLGSFRRTTPQVRVHLHGVSMAQKLYDLRNGFLDAALAPESGYGKGIASEAVWQDPPVAVIPRNHPLAERKRIALVDVVREPLVLCQPDTGLGQQCQIEQIVRAVTATPNITHTATTLCMLITLVFAGYGIGIATAAQFEAVSARELVLRPLVNPPTLIKTWLMMRQEPPSEPLSRFIEHARRLA